MIRTHYDNLQVTRNATDVVIRAAYKSLAQKNHPDKFDGRREEAERIMKILNEAYAVLSDPGRRKQHNEWIDRELAAESARVRAETPDTNEAGRTQFADKEEQRAAKSEEAAGAGGGRKHASAESAYRSRDERAGFAGTNAGWHPHARKWLSPRAKGHLCLFSALLCAILALRNGIGRNFADKQMAVSYLLGFLILIPFIVAYYKDAVLPAKSVAGSVALLVIFFGLLMFGGVNMMFRGDFWYGLGATIAFGWAFVTMYRG